MPLGMIFFVAWLAFMTITTAAFIIWAWREDQFSNEVNYRMLMDRDPEPWPGREKNKANPNGKTNGKGGD
jgi:hypothetical protein